MLDDFPKKYFPKGNVHDLLDKRSCGYFQTDLYNLALDKDVAKQRNKIYLVLVVICVLAVIYVSLTANYRTYVVRVDNATGRVEMGGELKATNYSPREIEIKYFLGWFIRNMRNVPLDPVAYSKQWDNIQFFLSQGAAKKLNELALQGKEQTKLGRIARQVEIKSIQKQPATKSTYQVRWWEKEYSVNGTAAGEKNNYVALLTVAIEPPSKEELLLVNPLGMKIKDFNFSKEAADEK